MPTSIAALVAASRRLCPRSSRLDMRARKKPVSGRSVVEKERRGGLLNSIESGLRKRWRLGREFRPGHQARTLAQR